MIWGLIIIYIFTAISMLMAARYHGKDKTGTYNFWTSTIAWIIELVLIWWALGWRFG